MELELKIRRHPSRQALLAYAENLVDNRAAIDRAMAAHISRCPVCQAEVRALQSSLAFAASAPDLEPDGESTARILLAGRQTRAELSRQKTPWQYAVRFAQASACAAAMLVVCGLTFTAFLDTGQPELAAPAFERAVPEFSVEASNPESLRRAAAEVAEEGQALSAALRSRQGESLSPQELEQLRVVQARDADIAAAVSALERNPHNVRATHVVNANLKSLRNLYVEGGSL